MSDVVGIVGFGRLGRALADLAQDHGLAVKAFDPVAEVPSQWRAASPAAVAAEAEEILLAVPVMRTGDAAVALRPHLGACHLVVDTGSVKGAPIAALSDALGPAAPWAGSHPLFGPTSVAYGERPLTVVVCPNPLHPDAAARARVLYERLGCRVVHLDADEHDRLMATTHALTYFVAKGMLDAGVPTEAEVAPPSFRAIQRTIEAVRADAAHLFTALHVQNPHAAAARRRLLDTLAAVDRDLVAAEAAGEDGTPPSGGLQIADLGSRSPALRATRDLIDGLDRELLALLARRAELARRAGAVKAEAGHGVRDPGREAALLAERRAWAGQEGLDSDAVEAIFLAILRFARGVQGA